jgi:hypothetical protein
MTTLPTSRAQRGFDNDQPLSERDVPCRCSLCLALLAAAANAERNRRHRSKEQGLTLLDGGKDRRVA